MRASMMQSGRATVLRWLVAFMSVCGCCSPSWAESPLSVTPTSRTFAVQFADWDIGSPQEEGLLEALGQLGVDYLRVDLNWPWIETQKGRYDWSRYDTFLEKAYRRGVRPLLILNRPNPLYGGSLATLTKGKYAGAPADDQTVEAFATWAAAAAVRYARYQPLLEIWNEPDSGTFWPPSASGADYLRLTEVTCQAIKRAVPDSLVVGPAVAQMPTRWRPQIPYWDTLIGRPAALACLDAISIHTHRFGQDPETVIPDYEVLRAKYLPRLPPSTRPVVVTEWGDAVNRKGISEKTQAVWLVRMMLTNLVEGIPLTNYYGLRDTGTNDAEREDRFGLLTRDLRKRASFIAYQDLIRRLRGTRVVQSVKLVAPDLSSVALGMVFCTSDNQRCEVATWSAGVGTYATCISRRTHWAVGNPTSFRGASLAGATSATVAVTPTPDGRWETLQGNAQASVPVIGIRRGAVASPTQPCTTS